MRGASTALALLLALVLAPAGVEAQDPAVTKQIRESQERLSQIRLEREELQREMERLRGRVRDAAHEVNNLERQVETSILALAELDYQSALLATNVQEIERELVRARDQLQERNAVLRHRLRSIYMEGPLHTVRVLLSARSFADLLNRYKYLHLITLHDRILLENVQSIEVDLQQKETEIRRNLAQMEHLRTDKMAEVAELEQLEVRARTALSGYRQQGQRAETRLERLEEDERRVSSAVADLERRRLEDERRRTVAGETVVAEASISTGDLGTLDWPVEGELAYRFGPERRPNGVVLRWNGIGIRAPAGTPVRAVEGGVVVHAGPTEGYGRSVWISHGGGYYTLYLHLRSVSVELNQRVDARAVVGTVGGEATPEGAHIEFQVRIPVRGGVPEPVDPLGWLRGRSR